MVNGLGIPARPIIGYVADRWAGPVNSFVVVMLVEAAVLFSWTGVHTPAAMWAFTAVLGFVTGACQGIFVGALASLTRDPRKMGTRFGMACTIIGFACLAGPPTAGALIDRLDGNYIAAQIWAAVVTLLGAVTIVAARWRLAGWGLKTKV